MMITFVTEGSAFYMIITIPYPLTFTTCSYLYSKGCRLQSPEFVWVALFPHQNDSDEYQI